MKYLLVVTVLLLCGCADKSKYVTKEECAKVCADVCADDVIIPILRETE